MEGRAFRGNKVWGGLEAGCGGGYFRVISYEGRILYSVVLWPGGLKVHTKNYYAKGRRESGGCRGCSLSFGSWARGRIQVQ